MTELTTKNNVILHDEIKAGLASVIRESLLKLGQDIALDEIYQALGPAPKIEMGHFAYPVFPFAKTMRMAPPAIANAIRENLPESDFILKAEAAGPYLNFTLDKSIYGEKILDEVLSGEFFHKKLTDHAPKTMIEYSQPNTHKEIHVGHMRNIALGDALIRMHRYCGYDIVSATFPGDVGTHVAKCLWYFKDVNKEPVPDTDKGAWLGELYVKANDLLTEIKGTPDEEVAKARMTEILKQLEAQSGEFYDLWKETRQWSIELMHKVYAWANVHFDVWYWESDVDASSVQYAKKNFNDGKLVESDGAIGMDLEEDGLGFAMMLKKDGTGLYLTKDVELAKRKFNDFGIKHSIYIVDKRQEHHFKQVFKVLEKLGFDQAKDCYHLKYDYVEGKDGKFESRKGNAVPLNDLIRKMEAAIRGNYLDPQVDNGNMTAEECQQIAEIVAKGAIKYGMIRIDPNKKITFDMDEWIKIEGDSGPYQQYTCARINSMVNKLGFASEKGIDWSLLDDDRELEIMVRISQFNDVVLDATQKCRTSMITAWLYELAKTFNNLYNSIIIRDITDEKLKNTRLALAKAVSLTIEKGLEILGIPVPEKM